MTANVPAEVVPIWYIKEWIKEKAEPHSALEYYVGKLIEDWTAKEKQYEKEQNEFLKELFDAAKKEEPQQIIKKCGFDDCTSYDCCPSCGEVLKERYDDGNEVYFCKFCGQAVKWI